MKIPLFTFIYLILIGLIITLANQGLLSVQWLRQLPYGDKLGHFILIGGLSFLVNLSFKCPYWRWRGVLILKACVYVALLISLEEFSQYFIPQRSFDLGDLAANYAGILCFGYAAYFLQKHKYKHN